MPAPAKIRSRLRLGRAERDGFSCLTARRVAQRWRRKSRAAGFVIESGAGVWFTPAFLWAVAVPAPAKIRSRLRQTNEAKNIWPGGICGMPPGQHCPEAVPARRGGTARTQRQANSSAKGAADTQKGLCVCRGLPSVIFRSANTGSLKISFYTGELSTVCALNLAP